MLNQEVDKETYREIYLTDRRFNIISRAKKYVAVLLVFVCVCMIFSPLTAYAAEDSSQHETVKVGFFAMDGYHMMDEEGNRSGYGYDFLRLMARYWDVDYEYVGSTRPRAKRNARRATETWAVRPSYAIP